MGIVRTGALVETGVPAQLVLLLKSTFSVSNFVELGTFKGRTAEWASNNFDRVITVEAQKKIFESTKQRLRAVKNIDIRFGESVEALPEILLDLSEPTIFWLDSHWCSSETYGIENECPLLEEITLLGNFAAERFILIDDARYFLSPPPKPHNMEQWPTIDTVIQRLKFIDPSCYIVVFDDVIVVVPARAKQLIATFCQAENVRRCENFHSKRFGIKGGINQVIEGLGVIAQGLRDKIFPSSNTW